MTTRDARAEILRTKDFIGWAVTSSNGANVGTVADILIDRKGQVRFLAIDPGLFKKPVLLPVESLEWGEGSLVSSWTDTEIRSLPPYDGGVPLTAQVLAEMGRAFPRYYGGERGSAGAFSPPDGPQVMPLKDAKDFRLAKGAPDLKGWTVYGSDNEKVGTVTQMLVDPAAMSIRYLDVDVADDLFGLADDRHVIVPMDAVELRERSRDAWVHGITANDIAHLPAYQGGPVDPVVAEATERAFRGASAGEGDAERAALPPSSGEAAPALPPPVAEPPASTAAAEAPPPVPAQDERTAIVDEVPPREP